MTRPNRPTLVTFSGTFDELVRSANAVRRFRKRRGAVPSGSGTGIVLSRTAGSSI